MSIQIMSLDKKSLETKRVLYLLPPLLIILIIYCSGSNLFSPSNKTLLQLLLFPLVLYGICRFLGSELKIPKALYILSAVFALLGVGYAYMYPLKAKRGGLVVSRLEGDELQNETRIFREQINSALDQNGDIRALSINEDFSSLDDAEDFISKNRKLKILISGNKKWINIFFPEKASQTLSELGLGLNLPSVAGLKMHYSVRTIGLSLNPSYSTALFIANLAEGVAGHKRNTRNDNFELSLLNASKIDAFWTSFSHKAYPMWFLGNHYLEASVSSGSPNRPILNCSIKAYKKAFSVLRKGDNPDLKASILNNLGVAYGLRGYLIGKKRDLKFSKKYFAWSVKVYREKSKVAANFSAAVIANENQALISSSRHKFVKSKAKKRIGVGTKVRKNKSKPRVKKARKNKKKK